MSMSEQIGFAEYVAVRRDTWVRAACLLTGDPHTAEDLVQSALIRVWPRWRRIAAQGDPDPYMRKVLMNVFLTSLRRRRWREVSADPHTIPILYRHPTAPAPGDGFETRQDLRHVLAGLAPRQRAVLVLRYYLDLSEAETAQTLGCSIGTVKSQTAKASARLRSHIEVTVHDVTRERS
jgi:RNA polymerase sigma-70 factor (sigma-E family)